MRRRLRGSAGDVTMVGMRTPVLALAPLLALAACAAPSAAPVSVYKGLGSKQCEGGGQTPAQLAEPLRQAGVPVLAIACGRDGRVRAAMCGLGDGRIGIFDVPANRVAEAERLGYARLASLPDATREPCP